MKPITKKDRIIALVESLNRTGSHEVASYIQASNFALKHGGASHHKYRGGLVDHSLEVYQNMKEKASGLNIPEDSIIICSIFHDLGKLISQDGHPSHSLAILDQCGFQLTKDERKAIATHHSFDGALDLNSLQSLLKRSDGKSTDEWKKSHPGSSPAKSSGKELVELILSEFSKI